MHDHRRRSSDVTLDELGPRQLVGCVLPMAVGSSIRNAICTSVPEQQIKGQFDEASDQGKAAAKPAPKLPDVPSWVENQLRDLTSVLKTDPARTKSEFRRLNLELTFHPTEAEPRAHYIVKGQCDLSALVFFYLRSGKSAVLDLMRAR